MGFPADFTRARSEPVEVPAVEIDRLLDDGGPCHEGPGCTPNDPDPADMIPDGDWPDGHGEGSL